MKYAKPMILTINNATLSIQGEGKSNPLINDSTHFPQTVAAYEADE